ncbi:S41 family peptidase, partial [Bacteroidota bacterium]
GRKAEDEIFHVNRFNEFKEENNNYYYYEAEENSILIDKIYIITTSSTASASEVIINSLKPFLDVKLIGSQTHGKPVGMRVFEYMAKDPVDNNRTWVVAPITFKGVNALGEGEYFNGFPIDGNAIDDLSKDWGDTTEASLSQAINYIKTGSFKDEPVLKSKFSEFEDEKVFVGFRREIGAF